MAEIKRDKNAFTGILGVQSFDKLGKLKHGGGG